METNLEAALAKIFEGIKDFDKIVDNILDNGDWSKEYNERICEASIQLRKIRKELISIKDKL